MADTSTSNAVLLDPWPGCWLELLFRGWLDLDRFVLARQEERLLLVDARPDERKEPVRRGNG